MNVSRETELENNKYVVIRNFMTEELKSICENYYKTKFFVTREWYICAGKLTGDKDVVQPFSKAKYSDTLSESILVHFLKDVSEITGKKLAPSYSYTRYYENGQFLVKHKDRPSCEYSITLPVIASSDTESWKIYVAKDEEDEGTAIELNVGDLLIYKGCEAVHWRNEFKGDFQVQLHLHYVDTENPESIPYINDGRKCLGLY